MFLAVLSYLLTHFWIEILPKSTALQHKRSSNKSIAKIHDCFPLLNMFNESVDSFMIALSLISTYAFNSVNISLELECSHGIWLNILATPYLPFSILYLLIQKKKPQKQINTIHE